MIQYMNMVPEAIRNKDGKLRKVIGFRKSARYTDDEILVTMLTDEDFLRVDKFANRMYGNLFNIGPVIDVNDEDYFSLAPGDSVRFANPNLVR